MIQRETINVIELGLGMCFFFTAGLTQGIAVQPILSSRHEDDPRIPEFAGYYSSTISLFAFTLANLVSAPFVIFFRPKWSLIMSSTGMTIHMLGFLHLNPYFMYFTSILQGSCTAVVWTAAGVILVENSSEKSISRNSGIMCILMMISTIVGGIFLLCVFAGSNDHKISIELSNYIYIGFSTFSILSGIIFSLMKTTSAEVDQETNIWIEMKKSIRLLFTADMVFLFPIFFFIGLETALSSNLIPTALADTNGFKMNSNVVMAWNSIAAGVGQVTAGIPLIILGGHANRRGLSPLILISCLTGFIAFILVFINIPGDASFKHTDDISLINPSISIALLAGFLLGFGDSFVSIGIYSFVSIRYAKEAAQANSIMKFVAVLPTLLAVYCGSLVQLSWQLTAATVTAVLGFGSFVVAERRTKRVKDNNLQ